MFAEHGTMKHHSSGHNMDLSSVFNAIGIVGIAVLGGIVGVIAILAYISHIVRSPNKTKD